MKNSMAYVHANFNMPSHTISSTFSHAPPMSAIDRFLLGHVPSKNPTHFENQPDPKQIQISPSSESLVGFCDYSSSSSSSTSSCINIANGSNVVNVEVLSDGGSIGFYSNNRGSKLMRKCPLVIQGKRISKGNTSRRKPSRVYIKGQWSEEEDSKLADLVNEHGDRSWALISTKLFGRAGKQCRERWNNHLRPDIKKDSWSEEEERILVQTHMQFGNKWAEIARHIPGRTENSIKNHWNATIRKQFSKRKTKKDAKYNNFLDNHNIPPSLLERYIIYRHFGAGYNILHHLDDVAQDFEADVAPVGPTVHFGGQQMEHDNFAMPNYFESNNMDPHSDQYGNIDLTHLWDPQAQYGNFDLTFLWDQLNQYGNLGFAFDSYYNTTTTKYYDFSPMAMFDPLNLDEMMFIDTQFPSNNLSPTPVNHHGFTAVDSTGIGSVETFNDEVESNFVTSILNELCD